MRPVELGDVPDDGTGNPKVYAAYPNARADLFDRLGRYCSFCERPIKAGLAVEHVHHKDAYADLECEWTNFLLACVNCNSTKATKEVRRKLVLLPDQDNTHRGLAYAVGGKVAPATSLQPFQKAKATRLIRLVGLDKLPTSDPQAKDLRWNDRREAWDKATRYHAMFQTGRISVDVIVDLCRADGHWSIWMTVFQGLAVVRLALIAAIPGTASCFDGNGNPSQRPSGQL